jgi:hypothetical protein
MAYICNTKEYTNVLISNLLFDEKIADMVEKNGGTFSPRLFKCLYGSGTFHLEQKRLDRVISGWKTGLPPVSVKKHTHGRFQVINGRHRVCATILNGADTVPIYTVPSLDI